MKNSKCQNLLSLRRGEHGYFVIIYRVSSVFIFAKVDRLLKVGRFRTLFDREKLVRRGPEMLETAKYIPPNLIRAQIPPPVT